MALRPRVCHKANCYNHMDLNNGGVYINYRNEERMGFCCIEHAALILVAMASRKDYPSFVKSEFERIHGIPPEHYSRG